MSEANLRIFLHLCKARESAIPNYRLLAVCAQKFSVMVCVYQYNCVISVLPKHELQICPNDMKMHWKHCVFDSP